MKSLFARLKIAVREHPGTIWSDAVSSEGITFAEELLGFALPGVLKRAYREISNGGFGPGPIVGLPGGYESSWGDLINTCNELRRNEECEEGWLPIIDWGCAQFSIIDCEADFQMVTLCKGDFSSRRLFVRRLAQALARGRSSGPGTRRVPSRRSTGVIDNGWSPRDNSRSDAVLSSSSQPPRDPPTADVRN
jgi:hypothetical protein